MTKLPDYKVRDSPWRQGWGSRRGGRVQFCLQLRCLGAVGSGGGWQSAAGSREDSSPLAPQPYPMYPATTSLVNVVPKLNTTGRDLLQVSAPLTQLAY